MVYAIFFATLMFFSPALAQINCAASDQSCDFYQCMEEQHPCGTKGYWLRFGAPYCKVFLRDQAQFSWRSQAWLQSVRLCLQERIGEVSARQTCSGIYSEAMHSHVGCYVDTGFCQLSTREKFRVYWYLKGALRDARTWQEAKLLNEACIRTYGPEAAVNLH